MKSLAGQQCLTPLAMENYLLFFPANSTCVARIENELWQHHLLEDAENQEGFTPGYAAAKSVKRIPLHVQRTLHAPRQSSQPRKYDLSLAWMRYISEMDGCFHLIVYQ